MHILYKTALEIQLIKEGGKYLNELLLLIYEAAQEGVKLSDLEKLASEYCISHKLKGAFKGYGWFPANLCLSVNDCLVHGIPDGHILKRGDVLKIDSGILYKNMVTDAAICKIIWWHTANRAWAELMWTTKEALDKSLELVKPWVSLWEYGKRVHQFVSSKWYSIVKSLTWHGVGKKIHEDPWVANYGDTRLKGIKFKPGMVLALEPITAEVSEDYKVHANKWNLITKHGDLGCQREYTIAITPDGYEILAGITHNLQ